MPQESPLSAKDVACLEDNHWTPILHPALDPAHPLVQKLAGMDPQAPVEAGNDPFTLSLAAVDADAYHRVHDSGELVFHTTGCTGDPVTEAPQDEVAKAMVEQSKSLPISFFYHLGDIAYKPDLPDPAPPDTPEPSQSDLYNREFYQAYRDYAPDIFAIGGNHDGKYHLDKKSQQVVLDQSSMWHFLLNFCALQGNASPDNIGLAGTKKNPAQPPASRQTMTQPYPFWILDTPVAFIIGLYANVANGGNLDDPSALNYPRGPQYVWLVNRLKALRDANLARLNKQQARKAILLAVHYPPYAAAVNFALRGDSRLWKPKKSADPVQQFPNALPLAMLLQQAFQESGQRPDAIFSAHAHLYQRLTYEFADTGQQMPCLIVGNGGHAPTEMMGTTCVEPTKDTLFPYTSISEPLPAEVPDEVLPEGLRGRLNRTRQDILTLDAYQDGLKLDKKTGQHERADKHYGFLCVKVTANTLQTDYFSIANGLQPVDSFTLNLSPNVAHNRLALKT